MFEALTSRVLEGSRRSRLAWACLSIIVIAIVDWRMEENISFGFLYLLPMLVVGAALDRLEIAGVAALCTFLTESFDQFPWSVPVGIPRIVLTFAAFFGAGYYGYALARSRRLADAHTKEVEREVMLRRETEEQLEFLISRSPASIFTLDAGGTVQLANDAAHRLLRCEKGNLPGKAVSQFFPALASVFPTAKPPFFHTEMECRARRQDGEVFFAHIWFSTYQTTAGPRLAAVVFDTSEELRDRAEFNLQQILSGSKVLVSALCHEIRNVCGAIGVIHSKLTRDAMFSHNEDFSALGTLVLGLERMAGLELRQTTHASAESTDVRAILEEFRIVIEPSFAEGEMSIQWELAETLPRVWADRQALLQAFLNLAKNSQRAMEQQDVRVLVIRASLEEDCVFVRFLDTGSGVSHPEHLFKPFQPGAQASGLGLYLSRTFVRSFQGDLRYERQPSGSCFAVLLSLAASQRSSMMDAS